MLFQFLNEFENVVVTDSSIWKEAVYSILFILEGFEHCILFHQQGWVDVIRAKIHKLQRPARFLKSGIAYD